jgi:hypothetical protein
MGALKPSLESSRYNGGAEQMGTLRKKTRGFRVQVLKVLTALPKGAIHEAVTRSIQNCGLTEVIDLATAARERGVSIMTGRMMGASLDMAEDREGGIEYGGGVMPPPSPELWV